MGRQHSSGTGLSCDRTVLVMRNFIRHPADIPIKIIKNESEDCYRQPLQDISIGGLRCRFNEPLARGAEIKIIIDLVEPVLEIPGRIIWCRPAGASYELGIEYRGGAGRIQITYGRADLSHKNDLDRSHSRQLHF